MSPGLKSARIDLKLSGQGNFWVGITNPASELPNSTSLTRYRVAHSCMFFLQIREKNAKKKYPVFLEPTPLGPAVREGGKQSDIPFVGRPCLFDLVLRPTSIHDSCTFARGSNRWTMAAQHTSSCLLYTSPSPRDLSTSRMPSSA